MDFGMAEALAYGTLALHRGVRPPQAPQASHQATPGADQHNAMQPGMCGPIASQCRALHTSCIWGKRLGPLAIGAWTALLSRRLAELL